MRYEERGQGYRDVEKVGKHCSKVYFQTLRGQLFAATTHLAAAVIVAVPLAIWVAGIADIMTTSQDTRMGLSTGIISSLSHSRLLFENYSSIEPVLM